MARVNRDAAAQVIELLNVRPDDKVLEVGFGPGVAIQLLAEGPACVSWTNMIAVPRCQQAALRGQPRRELHMRNGLRGRTPSPRSSWSGEREQNAHGATLITSQRNAR